MSEIYDKEFINSKIYRINSLKNFLNENPDYIIKIKALDIQKISNFNSFSKKYKGLSEIPLNKKKYFQKIPKKLFGKEIKTYSKTKINVIKNLKNLIANNFSPNESNIKMISFDKEAGFYALELEGSLIFETLDIGANFKEENTELIRNLYNQNRIELPEKIKKILSIGLKYSNIENLIIDFDKLKNFDIIKIDLKMSKIKTIEFKGNISSASSSIILSNANIQEFIFQDVKHFEKINDKEFQKKYVEYGLNDFEKTIESHKIYKIKETRKRKSSEDLEIRKIEQINSKKFKQ
jgi:hypothetical protein